MRTEPQHLCTSWTRSDLTDPARRPCLEAQIQLRARKHAVEFQADTRHFPRYYKVTPNRGIIPANSSVTLTVQLPITAKTRRTGYQHACGSALWIHRLSTDLRVHVRRYCEDDEEPLAVESNQRDSALWEQDMNLDTDYLEDVHSHDKAGLPRSKRTNRLRRYYPCGCCEIHDYPGSSRRSPRKGMPLDMYQSATFVKTLKLRPFALFDAVDAEECRICFDEMNVRRHAAGIKVETLFAIGCGHIFHARCLVKMTKTHNFPFSYLARVACPLCRRLLSPVEMGILNPRK